MGERRRLRLSPWVEAHHARTTAAIEALECAPPEEREARRRDLEALRDETVAMIKRNRAELMRLLDGAN